MRGRVLPFKVEWSKENPFRRLYLSKDLKEVREQAMRETGKGSFLCKGPEAVAHLAYSKNSAEAHVTRVE